ncbi:hypothetical protein DER45DRAFT_320443 [Fusarium avenaceum]|nr:hypothetical protein DER45DRAFT_320443 [Fusarium avenaceum]
MSIGRQLATSEAGSISPSTSPFDSSSPSLSNVQLLYLLLINIQVLISPRIVPFLLSLLSYSFLLCFVICSTLHLHTQIDFIIHKAATSDALDLKLTSSRLNRLCFCERVVSPYGLSSCLFSPISRSCLSRPILDSQLTCGKLPFCYLFHPPARFRSS